MAWAAGRPNVGDVIVAIDFGTSRTAFCWTVQGNAQNSIEVESLGDPSHGGSQLDVKTPTSILLDSHRGIAFGREAELKFAEEAADNPDWLLFKWFKIALHKPFEDDPLVESVDGRQLRLSLVLQRSVEYVGLAAVTTLRAKGVLSSHRNAHDVFWVLTLPAIWSDYAKFVMRKACFNAGLIPSVQSSRLLLALEPECAAIASQLETSTRSLWKVGSRFLIVDCGGGTVDITAHRVQRTSPLVLKELICAQGGLIGGIQVDGNFHGFLCAFLGKDQLAHLKQSYPGEFLNIGKEWETQKRMFDFDQEVSWLNLKIGGALLAMGLGRQQLRSMVDAWNQCHPVLPVKQLGAATIALSHPLVKSFFLGPIGDIVDTVEEVVKKNGTKLAALDFVVLVGGFAGCTLLQDEMRKRFRHRDICVIVGNRPDLLIVKGAAVFGAGSLNVLESRVSRYTVGVGATVRYDKKNRIHKKNKHKSYIASDGDRRLHIFSPHATLGDDVMSGSRTPRMRYFPLTEEQETITVRVLVSRNATVTFQDDPGVSVLASSEVRLNKAIPLDRRCVGIEFSFGATEVLCYLSNFEGEEIDRLQPEFKIF